jgi:hypothetical protein
MLILESIRRCLVVWPFDVPQAKSTLSLLMCSSLLRPPEYPAMRVICSPRQAGLGTAMRNLGA